MLELEGITAGYGETVVLRDVSLSVPDSGVVALLGPNGAGKTTTLRAASGLIRPISGRVLLDGEDVTGLKPYAMARRGLCHLPEGHGIFPSLTVKENIVLNSPKGKERESLVRAGDQFPVLAARLGQQAGSLSGGEQQMLSLVRAYLMNPRIVVVDEASLGLSPLLVDRVFDALQADRRGRHGPAARRAVRDPCARARGHGLHHEPRPGRPLGCGIRPTGGRGVRAVPRH